MPKTNFIHGAFILLIAGMFMRVLGLLYQVLIIRIIGAEAIGLYNMVYPVFIMGLVLATAGLPPAISKLVSKQAALSCQKNVRKILKVSVFILLCSGILCTALIIIFVPYILKYLYTDTRVNWVLYAMLPSITLSALGSALRGFFQGLQNMVPSAASQCLEQVSRIACGLFLAFKLKNHGVQAIAIGLAISMLVGEVIGLSFLIIFFIYQKDSIIKTPTDNKSALGIKQILVDLFSFGVPTTFTRLVSSITLTLEASLIPLILQKTGFTIQQATAIYGQFSGICLTILSIPTILTFSLAVSLIPAMSEAQVQGANKLLKFRSSEALRLTILFGLPTVMVLLLVPENLSSLLFNMPQVGTTLRILSLGGLFLYLIQTSNGILQGLGFVRIIFFNTIIGSIIKLVGIFYLVAIPWLNINGAALSFVASYLVVCFLNMQAIHKTTGLSLQRRQIFLPFLAALIMGVSLLWAVDVYTSNVRTVISLLFAGFLYLFLMIIWGQLNIKTIFNKK